VAHTTHNTHKRQTDTVTNMTVEDIKAHRHIKKYSESGQT